MDNIHSQINNSKQEPFETSDSCDNEMVVPRATKVVDYSEKQSLPSNEQEYSFLKTSNEESITNHVENNQQTSIVNVKTAIESSISKEITEGLFDTIDVEKGKIKQNLCENVSLSKQETHKETFRERLLHLHDWAFKWFDVSNSLTMAISVS